MRGLNTQGQGSGGRQCTKQSSTAATQASPHLECDTLLQLIPPPLISPPPPPSPHLEGNALLQLILPPPNIAPPRPRLTLSAMPLSSCPPP